MLDSINALARAGPPKFLKEVLHRLVAEASRRLDMEVWQQARVIAGEVYAHTGQGEFARDFGFRDQIRRAVVSVMA
jgi:hypothetical protein